MLTGATSMTADAPPAPHIIRATEGMSAQIINVYGLAETYSKRRRRRPEWDAMAAAALSQVKTPQSVEFGALPKTTTGKIQKYILRNKETAGAGTPHTGFASVVHCAGRPNAPPDASEEDRYGVRTVSGVSPAR